jgi:hypothetical protein
MRILILMNLRIISFPKFSRIRFQPYVRYYQMMRRGRRLTLSPTNNTHKYS